MIFKEIILLTNNTDELKDFYLNKIGVKLVSEKKGSSFTVNIGKTKLTFQKSDGDVTPYYHFAINIPENKINDAKDWLNGKAAILPKNNEDVIDFTTWNAHSVYFYDPTGNIVELIARHFLENPSNEPFGAGSLLNISELGMPVEDMPKFVAAVEEKTGETIWDGNNESFAAIGDQQGLIIAVPTNRNWYPTEDKLSYAYPITLKVKGDKGGMHTFDGTPYKIIIDSKLDFEIPAELQILGTSFLDENLKLKQYPPKEEQRIAYLKYLKSKFENGRKYNQKEVNEILNENHLFNDAVMLRRDMVDAKLLFRTDDGREYWIE
jgi:catechol-2,3-dioxygenase